MWQSDMIYSYFCHGIFLTVDEKERAQGNDPEKELEDGGFKDYIRP